MRLLVLVIFWFGLALPAVFAASPSAAGDHFPPDPTIDFIRKEFRQARDSGRKTRELVGYLEDNIAPRWPDYPVEIFAYYAALKGLQAKHEGNPITKLKYLKSSLVLLDDSVARAGENLEVRFLRFASLHHFPGILGIGRKRSVDIQHIIALLQRRDFSRADNTLQCEIMQFMLESGRLTPPQRDVLTQLYWEFTRK